MESISSNDIQFLVALNASEESRLQELYYEFEKWSCDKVLVLDKLRELIQDGTMLISKPVNDTFSDLTEKQSLAAVQKWEQLNTTELMLYLTEAGFARWESDDWGISTKRARHLMYSNNGKVTRVR
ncbi:MAG: hypothetical protein K6L75_11045 [Cellvibrionaceae bacterium]